MRAPARGTRSPRRPPPIPAQVYGALAAAIALVVIAALLWLGAFRVHDGSVFFVGLLVWAIGRFLVTFAWRDDPVLGPVRAGGLIALGVVGAGILGIVLARVVTRRSRRQAHGHPPASPVIGDAGLDWPDPETRPRF